MKRLLLTISFILSCNTANAALVTWELADFSFDDGGTAYGSFVYDTDLNVVSNIDVYTTEGSRLSGRHYIATAGVWGSNTDFGILAFTDTSSTSNYQGAGWLRMDFHSISNVTDVGISLDQWLAVGAESYCVNSDCSSAANEITDPDNSRETISGYILSTQSVPSPVPLPASVWLFISGLVGIYSITSNLSGRKKHAA
ncbi:MAG: hypothetical protein GY787_03480 [Alteromonadales bacterium]|nr:hypothetical protein [Alteromonadales bacterium]